MHKYQSAETYRARSGRRKMLQHFMLSTRWIDSGCPICGAQSTEFTSLIETLKYSSDDHWRQGKDGVTEGCNLSSVPLHIKRWRKRGIVIVCQSCGLEMSTTYHSIIRSVERVLAGEDKWGPATGDRPYEDRLQELLEMLRQIAPPETRGGAGGTDSALLRQLREEAKATPRPKRPGPPA